MATRWRMLATEQAHHDIPMQEVKKEREHVRKRRGWGRVVAKDSGSFLLKEARLKPERLGSCTVTRTVHKRSVCMV